MLQLNANVNIIVLVELAIMHKINDTDTKPLGHIENNCLL